MEPLPNFPNYNKQLALLTRDWYQKMSGNHRMLLK
eukprot:XP_001707109.1 Hypothetical protein GL50803_28841 [Giardia lamblia ATCC 50803]